MESKRKKITTAVIAGVTAVALLLGGTFAWQSISQTALNEKEAVINPGGRLHDDFNGENKDIYVENFADDDIFARVRLNEYFEIVMNKNTPAEKTEVVTTGATKADTSTYPVHKFGEDNATDDYWQWITGGQKYYMPTFNKNKDSLVADINGTFAENYEDYVEYEQDATKESAAIYDSDTNSVDEVRTDLDNLSPYVEAGNIKTVTETHTAKETEEASLISMEEWLQLVEDGEDTANFWVYDTDGWIYWSSPIKAGTATGLLLDAIELKNVMDDSYYYAIEVTGQFITADDLGKDDNTGFYDTTAGTAPSKDALTLLEKIGVDVGETDDADDDVDADEDYADKYIYKMFVINDKSNREYNEYKYDLYFFSSDEVVDIPSEAADMWSSFNEDDIVEVTQLQAPSGKSARLPSTGQDGSAYTYPPFVTSVSFLNKVQPTSMYQWFMDLGEKVSEIEFDFTNLDTSRCTDMSWAFYDCMKVKELNVSSFDTSCVTDMSQMFHNCESLQKLDLSSWDTSKVTNMLSMFSDCSQLTEVNLSSFDTSNVTNFGSMFYLCENLQSLNIKTFNTTAATDMRFMFYLCELLENIDVTTFNTSNVENMEYMFGNCRALNSIDLSSFDTSKVKNMQYMFWHDSNLVYNCSDWNVSKVTNHDSFNLGASGVTEPNWVN